MTTIYLIRHGQTDWNKEEIFRGRADVPLNDRGRDEAWALSRYLEGVSVDACYSSPLGRARETAEIVARPHSVDVNIDDGIIDVDYGEWQGFSEAKVRKNYAETYQRWHERPHHIKFPGGESLSAVRKRALPSLEVIRAGYPDGVVFVVAHRVVTKVVMCAVLGLGNAAFWRIRQDNCAFNVIEYSPNGAVVRTMNDICHMNAAGVAPTLADF
jgi:broad specificity phosphatase PhoE